ncbi:MAG: hypothetical protein WCO28_09405 [Bacteroidota bacterium]
MENKILKIVLSNALIFLSSIQISQAQSNYNLIYDNHFSSGVGAENLLTIHKAFYSFEDRYLPPEIFNGDKKSGKYLNIIYRASKNIIDYPTQVFLKLVQHEVFGHGARFSEFGYDGISYNLNLTPPFGTGHGFAMGSSPKHGVTIDENMSIDIAGVEANTILSDVLRTKWVMDDSTNYNDFFLYFRTHYGISEYIYRTYYNNKMGDISDYLYALNLRNSKSGYSPTLINSNLSNQFTISELAKFAVINLFDPFQFLSFYNWCGYIISGKPKGKLQMIKIGNVKYLPSFHLGLTPFGAEFYMDNYLKYQNRTFKIYGRLGDSRFENFWGGGISAFNIINNNYCYVNATTDIWNQPSLQLHNTENYLTHNGTNGLGICVSATAGVRISKKNPVSVVAICGYKTDGFLPGEILNNGFFFRTGLSFLNR